MYVCMYACMYVYVRTCAYIYNHVYMRYVQKIWSLKLDLPRQKRTLHEMFIFLKISHLLFNTHVPANFPLIKVSLKLVFIIYSSSNLTTEIEFLIRKQGKLTRHYSCEHGGSCACTIQCFIITTA